MVSPTLAKFIRFDLIGRDKTREAFDSVKRGARDTSRTVTKALAFVGVAGGLIGLVRHFDNLTERGMVYAETLKSQSSLLGIGVERLQEYRFASEQTGESAEAFDAALVSLTRRLGEAQQGKGDEIFRQYGIDLRDTEGHARGVDAVLRDLFDTTAALADPQERLRVLYKAGGNELARLTNLAREGAVGLDEYAANAHKLGQILEADVIEDLDAAQRELKVINRAVEVNEAKTAANLKTWKKWSSGVKLSASETAGAVASEMSSMFDPLEEQGLATLSLTIDRLESLIESRLSSNANLEDSWLDRMFGLDIAGQDKTLDRLREQLDEAEKVFAERKAAPVETPEGGGGANDPLGDSDKAQKFIEKLRFEEEQLARTNVEQAIYSNLKAAGVERTSAFGMEIEGLTNTLETHRLVQGLLAEETPTYAQQLEYLHTLVDSGKISWDQYSLAVGRVAEKMRDDWANSLQSTLGNMQGFTGSLSRENDKWFRINQSFGIASALISTYQGASKALELGPILGPIAAAATIASGLAYVAQIASTKPGGGGGRGGGGRISAGGGSSLVASSREQDRRDRSGGAGREIQAGTSRTAVHITLKGRAIFGRDDLLDLVRHINEAVGDTALITAS